MSRLKFPNPLWLKESGSYVDIFSSAFHGNDVVATKSKVDDLLNNRRKKDNGKSAQFRLEGNQLYAQSKYHLALEKYNKSVCYAENDTDVLALAYSNRSSCYLKLTLFEECLTDIELAIQYHYPANLMHKLDSRRTECLHALSKRSAKINCRSASLTFAEHTSHAGVADCLQLQRNTEWGRHVITTRSLDIDDTVMIEGPFSFIGHDCNDSKYYRCSHCYKELLNFIPCKECVFSMFCSNKCLEAANESRHKFECKFTPMESNDCEGNEKDFQLVLDMLWKINATFDTVDELIRTIESIVSGGDVDARSDVLMTVRLAMILQLETNKEHQDSNDVQRLIGNSLKNYSVAMTMSEFRERFASEEHRRFLQHLILHLVHTAKQSVLFSDLNVDVDIFREAELRDYGIGLYPIGSYLNHSCVPNVFCYSVDDRLICKVIRPIKCGEQLFRSYV